MANEFILSGDDMELMGAGFLRRLKRRAVRAHDPRYQFRKHSRRARKVSRAAISGDDLEMMGMGRSFLRRQAARASKIVRPLAHQALNIAAKIPVYGAGVSAARGFASSLSVPKQVVLLPKGTATAETGTGTPGKSGSKLPLILGAVALGVGGLYLATKKRAG